MRVSARVLRDASWQVIAARDLVPGDIVRVRPGDIIPADVKLLTGALSVDQSALTGESVDAEKETGDVLSSGSVVRRGEGNGVVLLTGAQTYFGRTTELVQLARPKFHIEAVVAKLVRLLFVIVCALLSMVIVLSLVRGVSLIEMIPLMLVLLTCAIPVSLPVMLTVSMAVVSAELAKRGVLVTRLSAGGGCCDNGRALRGQDGHDHNQPIGRHWSDPARPVRRKPTCCSPEPSPPRKPTRTRSIWHFLPPRKSGKSLMA